MYKTFNTLNDKLLLKRNALLVGGIILLLNTAIYIATDYKKFTGSVQSRGDATGFCTMYGEHFFYFYYYTSNFPLATLDVNLAYSKEGALEQIRENGEDLIMEYKHWSRMGENARIWAFYPSAILKGTPENPSLKLFNVLVFVFGLLSLFFGFRKADLPIFGLLMVAIINVTPYFLYEVFSRENDFGMLHSIFFVLLGINAPFLLKKYNQKHIYLPILGLSIISAFLIGFFSEIRNEILVVFIGLMFMYIVANVKILSKMLALIIALSVFYGTKKMIRGYFKQNFKETAELVEEKGGHVYTGPGIPSHAFWHPIFCGLGDFDKKYGYEWNDRLAYKYAVPVLKEKYNIDLDYTEGELFLNEYYDKDSLYYKKFVEIPHYEEIIKNKVLSDIASDPLWYIGVLGKRVVRIFSNTLPFPFVGWIMLVIAYLLYKRREWKYLKLIFVSLPLSINSFVIYSGKGATFNSVFPFIVVVILIMGAIPNRIERKSNSNEKQFMR